MTLLSVMYIQCIILHTDDSKDMSVLIKPTNLNVFSLIKFKKKLVLGHVILSNFRLASVVFRNVWFVSDYFSFSSVQSLNCVQLFATLWTAACQASLSITTSRSLLKLTSFKLVMPSNHLILCHPLLLLPSIFSSIRDFSNE